MNSQMDEEEHRPVHNPGLRSGAEGGEHVHHEKKSVLKKVKAKAKKIKDTITKHGHETQAHDDIHARRRDMKDSDEQDDDDVMEEDPEVHGAPIYESKEVRSYVPGHVVTSIQHDVVLAGAHPTTAPVAAGHHGTSSIHDVTLGGAHQTTAPVVMGRHGTSSIQRDDVYGGSHETTAATTPAAVGHHGTSSIQHDAMLGGAQGTGSAMAPVPVGRHGTTSIHGTPTGSVQHDVMLAGAHGTAVAAALVAMGHHGTSSVQHGLGGAHGTTAGTGPLAVGHHGTNISDANIELSREAHNLKDHRSFIPEQVGVSKHDGVTFGGSQTRHGVGYAGAHDQTNLPIGSSMGGVFPQKTGILDRKAALEADPHAPRGDRQPDNYQSKLKDPTGRGGEEIGITPILHSLDKILTTYDDEDDTIKQGNVKIGTAQQEGLLEPNAGLADKNRSQPVYSGTGSHDQFSPEPISHPPAQHGSRSATCVISDKAIPAKNPVASKLSYGGQREQDHQKTHQAEKTMSPSSVTDYGKKVASTVYEKVAGAGGAVMAKMPGSQPVYNKGVSTKEYLTEKVSPGEEDKALSEVISGALHKGRAEEEEEDLEDEEKAEPRGKVTFSAKVARQLGGKEEAHPSVEDLGSGVSGPAGGGAMVDKLRDTVTSWLGIGGETDEPSSLVWHDIPKDANEADQQDKGRGTYREPRLE